MIKSNKVFNILNNFGFLLISMIMIYPFWYILMYSFSGSNSQSINSLFLVPQNFTLENYSQAFKNQFLYSGFYNSIIVTVLGTLINLLITIMLAYPLSRKKLEGKAFCLMFIVFTMIFNGGIIPTYLVVRGLHLVNTLWALMLPVAVNVYFFLIMIKFLKNIPESLIESAYIDGYNDIGILIRIILPLSIPSIAAIGLFYGVNHWNEFFRGMIYMNDKSKWTLQVVLINMIKETTVAEDLVGLDDMNLTPEGLKMAIVVLTILPIIAVYPLLQKYFVTGIMIGSVKG